MNLKKVEPASVTDAKAEQAARAAFVKAYEKLCKEHGYQLGARGYLQQLEGTVFQVKAAIEIVPLPKPEEKP